MTVLPDPPPCGVELGADELLLLPDDEAADDEELPDAGVDDAELADEVVDDDELPEPPLLLPQPATTRVAATPTTADTHMRRPSLLPVAMSSPVRVHHCSYLAAA